MKKTTFLYVLMLFMVFTLDVSRCYSDTKNPLALNQLVYEIRDPHTDAKKFRECLEKIGEYLSLEILEQLNTKEVEIQTLTGKTAHHVICDENPVLITILRAGIPLYLGVQKVFPDSEVGFLGMSRDEKTLQSKMDYVAIPNVKNQSVIIVDTMIATGGSVLDAINIVEAGGPKSILVLGAIASEAGIARILDHNPEIKVYAAAIDPLLNKQGYIIPGLGDAGDRAYGKKQESLKEAQGAAISQLKK